jgi:hypothetical protein
LEPGDRIEFIVQHDGGALMIPLTIDARDLRGLLAPAGRVSFAKMDEAVSAGAAARVRRRG